MKTFSNWAVEAKGYTLQEISLGAFGISQMGGNPTEKIKKSIPSDKGNDHDSVLKEVIKLALTKFPEETKLFLDQLAIRDEEMKELVAKMRNEEPSKEIPKKPEMGDIVVPPQADQGMPAG